MQNSTSSNIYKSITVENYANATIKKTTNKNEKSAKKPRVILTVDYLLNSINEKGLSKDNCVKIKNFPGGNPKTILDEIEELVSKKQDTLIVDAGTNDLTKAKTVLKNAKKP